MSRRIGERIVASKNYIIRQATILLKIAKTIKDPKISAALIDKAADIKDRDDPLRATQNWGPRSKDDRDG
jgi:hypothetical protein